MKARLTKAKKKKATRSPANLSTLDDFLKEEGKLEEFQAIVIKEVLAWQIAEAMKANNISRSGLATKMGTSRSQIGRLLDPKDGNVTLSTLQPCRANGGAIAAAGVDLSKIPGWTNTRRNVVQTNSQ